MAKKKKKQKGGKSRDTAKAPVRLTELLRVPAGLSGADVLAAVDPSSTPGFTGSKADEPAALAELEPRLDELQEQLYAECRTGGSRSLLLVLQGMDTSGKGGTLRHVVGLMDPQGVHITAFKAPTEEEKRHDFLWRIRMRLPEPGVIGVFDRSHYEDVGVVRVHSLVARSTWSRRYATINRFEKQLVDKGTRVVKCFLHVSPEETRQRLLARLDDPTKHWKYNPGDVDERALWGDYQEAYGDALAKCNPDTAPWFIVPADRKWFRNWAITKLLIEQLEEMNLAWPPGQFDVEVERQRLVSGG